MSSPALDIFGPIITATHVEAAVQDTLTTWMNTYLREIEYQNSMTPDTLQSIANWFVATKMDKENAEITPTVVIISPGLAYKEPQLFGDGNYLACWNVGVGIFVSANNRSNTMNLLRYYAGAIRGIMGQKRALGGAWSTLNPNGFANDVFWLGETYEANYTFTDEQTIGAGSLTFEVDVMNVLNRYAGPTTPGTPPGTQWPEIETSIIQAQEGVQS